MGKRMESIHKTTVAVWNLSLFCNPGMLIKELLTLHSYYAPVYPTEAIISFIWRGDLSQIWTYLPLSFLFVSILSTSALMSAYYCFLQLSLSHLLVKQ